MSLKPISESITEERVLSCDEDDVKSSYKQEDKTMESTFKGLYSGADEKISNQKIDDTKCAGNKAKMPIPLPNSKSD